MKSDGVMRTELAISHAMHLMAAAGGGLVALRAPVREPVTTSTVEGAHEVTIADSRQVRRHKARLARKGRA